MLTIVLVILICVFFLLCVGQCVGLGMMWYYHRQGLAELVDAIKDISVAILMRFNLTPEDIHAFVSELYHLLDAGPAPRKY